MHHPVRLIGAAAILGGADAICDGNMLLQTMRFLLDIDIPLIIILDSKDSFDFLSTQGGNLDRSIRADVSVSRFEVCTLGEERCLFLKAGRLPLSLSLAVLRSADSSLG